MNVGIDIYTKEKRQRLTFKPKESDSELRGRSLTVDMANKTKSLHRFPSDSTYYIKLNRRINNTLKLVINAPIPVGKCWLEDLNVGGL